MSTEVFAVGDQVLYWDGTPNGGYELNGPAQIVKICPKTVVLERRGCKFRVNKNEIQKCREE